MFAKIKKSASAIALSATIALGAITVTPTQARANDAQDIIGVIAGLAALYAIGRAIEEHNDDRPARASGPGGGGQGGHGAGQVNHRIAPAECFREFGNLRGYMYRCTQNNVSRPNLLPSECLIQFQTPRGQRMMYRPRCLARHGWTRETGFRP